MKLGAFHSSNHLCIDGGFGGSYNLVVDVFVKKIVFRVFEVIIIGVTVGIVNYVYVIIFIIYRNYFEFLLIIRPIITLMQNHSFFNLAVFTICFLRKVTSRVKIMRLVLG